MNHSAKPGATGSTRSTGIGGVHSRSGNPTQLTRLTELFSGGPRSSLRPIRREKESDTSWVMRLAAWEDYICTHYWEDFTRGAAATLLGRHGSTATGGHRFSPTTENSAQLTMFPSM